ncbi:hypothetical protein [Luteimonas sp. MC1572]|uniref:hypothetical protein n=1 Tax=Luteimonas sp. MC1572 TaxID=2799325 RepID=UPI0018F08716|nr:hypothetical protein [Luteimonas sp. MC1572]MBJ6981680.1 hypothetical protein [Luteimonas sp. MC1572]QQO02972.1 hypothetical protein JGR64_12555 [Luteimonas sp. MC1572]
MSKGAWINGRTLQDAVTARGIPHRFGKINPTSRVALDLEQDSYLLGIEKEHGYPFSWGDDTRVTIHDFHLTGSQAGFAPTEMLTLANMAFTRRALDSAANEFAVATVNNETARISAMAKTLDLDDLAAVLDFSKNVVVTWGRGHRVWGNLVKRHNSYPQGHAAALAEWLRGLSESCTPAVALAPGTRIKGLGVSFASKHLRLFDPDRFATLDEVISLGLGYALNGPGYNLWLHDLQRLKVEHKLPHRIGDLEGGIFVLVRQGVRGVRGQSH